MCSLRQFTMRRLWLLMGPIILAAFFGFLPWQLQASSPKPLKQTIARPFSATITSLETAATGLAFTLHTPPLHLNGQTTAIEVTGLNGRFHTPGLPALPYYTTWIAIPPGADVHVTTTAVNVTSHTNLTVGAVPQPTLAETPTLRDTPTSMSVFGEEGGEFGRFQSFPGQRYAVSEPMYYRDMRLVRLELYPLRYKPTTHELEQVQTLNVLVQFEGATTGPTSSFTDTPPYLQSLSSNVLNFEQGLQWRSLPAETQAAAGPSLPTGTNTYKIEVSEDGIYEISGADLQSAGMDLGTVDPNTIEMTYRGETVAYQFVGNPGDGFQVSDRIRFYGWAFDGPRTEKQFIIDNVFWLWADGTASTIITATNKAGQGYPTTTTFTDTITREPENYFFATWTNEWDQFPNEPDAWYWDYFSQNGATPITRTYAMTLPNPADAGPDAQMLVELLSKSTDHDYEVRSYLNDHPNYAEGIWQGRRNVNITTTVPLSSVVDGVNNADVVLATEVETGRAELYLNRITISYLRRLVAIDDQLFFADETGGAREFHVANLSENNPDDILVWNISNRRQPVAIHLAGADIQGAGSYTVTVGSNHDPDSRFIATTTSNVRSVHAISQYTPQSLNPPAMEADWIAISHESLMTATNQLATHRANPTYGGLETYVVDVEDVINQFGHGLPLPSAIRDYLTHALASWNVAPSYVLLMGDATQNPRHLPCPTSGPGRCSLEWDTSAPELVLTDLVFEDRFQGLIPSDHTFVLLAGDDPLPDMAIGRIAAETNAEAENTVAKIIRYEQNQLTPEEWQKNILFVADDTDIGGNFCLENQDTSATVPAMFNKTQLCLPEATTEATDQLRQDMYNEVNGDGVTLLNYRGHGSIQFWASPHILDNDSGTDFWVNFNKPTVILSADCLDGHFAWPGAEALSETYLALDGVGTAAHWSSTGLGFTFEHTVLHEGFYEGLYQKAMTTIGDATNYAKLNYYQVGYDESELYSFTLQGDPAMQLFRPSVSLDKTSLATELVDPNETVHFQLTVQNGGLYAGPPTVEDTLPVGLVYDSFTSTKSATAQVEGQDVTFHFDSGLAWGETAVITLTATITGGVSGGIYTNNATVSGYGLDTNPGDESDSATVTVVHSHIYLPYVVNVP